jgi:DNA repair protein RecO
MAKSALLFRGFVIRTQPLGEADQIVVVFTEDGEKQVALAKQSRKSKKRFGSSLDLFDFGRFETIRSRTPTNLLQSFIAEGGYRELRGSLSKIACASLLAEVVDLLIPESHGDSNHADTNLFAAFAGGLTSIVSAPNTREELRNLYLTLASILSYAGYYDHLEQRVPSLHALRILMNIVEQTAERRLRTKDAVEMVAQGGI